MGGERWVELHEMVAITITIRLYVIIVKCTNLSSLVPVWCKLYFMTTKQGERSDLLLCVFTVAIKHLPLVVWFKVRDGTEVIVVGNRIAFLLTVCQHQSIPYILVQVSTEKRCTLTFP